MSPALQHQGESPEDRRARIEADSRYREGQCEIEDALCARELSVRAFHGLYHGGNETLADVTSKTAADLLKVRNFGRGSLREVRQFLRLKGLFLRDEGPIR